MLLESGKTHSPDTVIMLIGTLFFIDTKPDVSFDDTTYLEAF